MIDDALMIGGVRVWPPVVLAPMAGVTNPPFRSLCRELATAEVTHPQPNTTAGLFVSEMISARGLVEGSERTWNLADSAPGEWPRSIQLYGTEPVSVAEAVRRLVDEGRVDHIDMNFGCPVRKVTRQGGGAALPYKRELLRSIVAAAVRAAGPVPVTIKFRIGIDEDHRTHLDTARIAADEGCAAIALHARTAAQWYSGTARWEAIAELVEAVEEIPVLGNGDIWQASDALAMMNETGCAGVVVGRGCLGRPWLFADLVAAFEQRPPAPTPALGQVAELMVEHARRLADWVGEALACRMFRRHANWYVTGYPVGGRARDRLARVSSLIELDEILAELDHHAQPAPGSEAAIRGHSQGPQQVALPDGWLDDTGWAEIADSGLAHSGG